MHPHFSSAALRALATGFVAGLLFTFAPSCGDGSKGTCSALTCTGCCDEKGLCVEGNFSSACGSQGNTCQQCRSNEACFSHLCALISGTGGGNGTGGGFSTGGSTGTGGGFATGGSTGTGGGFATGGGTGTGGGAFNCNAGRDAGPPVVCTSGCQEGFHCEQGVCVLNGNSGPLQVTLRWNTGEDLDLHLIEPKGTSSCEIYYDLPNRAGSTNACGAVGSLDLDSEAACVHDGVDIENIIYPPGMAAPSGKYIVRIDHYQNCNASLTAVPFEVEVRALGQTLGFCGVFRPSDSDWDTGGQAGAGRTVMNFNMP